jgi:hypothetical protein
MSTEEKVKTSTEGLEAGVGLSLDSEAAKTKANETMLATLIKTAAGREKLAISLGPSIRRRKHFMSFASAPTIHTQESTYVRYRDKFNLLVVDDEGGEILYKKNYRDDSIISYRIPVPVFSLSANPMIPIHIILAGEFNIVARALNIAKAEIGGTEDSHIIDLWNTGAQMANDGVIDGNKDIPWSDNIFKEAKEVFAKRGLSMKACFVHPRTGGVEILKWLGEAALDTFSTETKDVGRGILGYKDGVEFRHSRHVAPGFTYFTAERVGTEGGRNEMSLARYTRDVYAAYIIEESPLSVVTTDRPDLEQIGFNFSEEVGLAANPIAVQRVAFDSEFVKARDPELGIEDLAQGV